MKQWKDPFPPTPERFSLRVEQTLGMLEETDLNRGYARRTLILLVAAILAALLAATAVAAIAGNSHIKERLAGEGAGEVADLGQEPHIDAAPGEIDGFAFSVDEILWEDRDLYISYSLTVPDDRNYLVAMYTPTLNGKKLEYDAKGWTSPKFFDPQGVGESPSVLLLGGRHDTGCNELWTFRADPRLRDRRDNALHFEAVLLRTDCDLIGGSDWTDMLNPPSALGFDPDWQQIMGEELGDGQLSFMDAMTAAMADGGLTLDELTQSGFAEYVDHREIAMTLDASSLSQALYNDVAEHDFDVDGVHVHIDSFRMTHLGVRIVYTASVPGASGEDRQAMDRLNDFVDGHWHFCTPDGKAPGYSLGGSGSGGWSPLADWTPAYRMSWAEDVVLPLEGLDALLFAPVTWRDDDEGNQLPPAYDMDRAITLTPTYSEAVAQAEADATPEPTRDPDAGMEDFC